jgi:hypothetical protein
VPAKKKVEEEDCVCKQYDLIWGAKVSCEFRKKVVDICKDLWGESRKIEMANGLMAVIYVETSGTFSPSKIELKTTNEKRKDGSYKREYRGLTKEEILKLDENFSGAVGLIQFTPPAIKSLNKQFGYNLTKRKLALMTDSEQLDYVKKYFELNKAYTKITLPEDIYLHVFAPIGVNKNDDFVLYDKEKTKKEYDSNESVDVKDGNNDGKIQRREILNRYYTSFNKGKNNKENDFTCGAIIHVKKVEKKNNNIVTFDNELSEERKKVVTQKSIEIIEKAAKNSSNNKIIITSTIRSTRKQAEVMYSNESNGNHIRYAAPGREVIQVFNDGKTKRLPKETIINNMDKKIIELGSQDRRVSLHCVSKETYAKNNIIDISYTRGVTNKIDLTKELAKDESVTKVIHPFSSLGTTGKLKYDSKEPAIHVEIKQ